MVVIGAGWGGLSTAHTLVDDPNTKVTVIEAAPRVGGLVRDGFTTLSGQRPAEAGQHGFWNNYYNIFRFLDELGIRDSSLTGYAEQGQYSPRGLEAVWPVYKDQVNLPTGLAQAFHTKFLKLSILDRATALPLVLAFSEFDNSEEAWKKYDQMSFRDLCVRLGVSKKLYDEAFEPMILTGLFAPGAECSAAAALGMAYFFVMQSQNSFDVQWCRGNIGEEIFDPWVAALKEKGVSFQTGTRVKGFEKSGNSLTTVLCEKGSEKSSIEADSVVFAVGAESLKAFARFCPKLSCYDEFRRFANLRGTSVLATRLFLDRDIQAPYSANACWGFDEAIGMTMFDIKALHGTNKRTTADAPGAVFEIDYYHASPLLVMDDNALVQKAKKDLDTILGTSSRSASVADAAIVRLNNGVNWYYPGSYRDMPSVRSSSLDNVYFAGDIVKSDHGAWSQEKAFVTGRQAANMILGNDADANVLPLAQDEPHVALGRQAVALGQTILGYGDRSRGPSLVDFLF